MSDLSKKALTGFIQLQIFFALLLFVPAWSVRFWEAWVYWTLFGVSVLLITLYFLKHDPALIESRLAAGPGAEREKSQKVIQALASLLSCALYVVPGVERRFHPSVIPLPSCSQPTRSSWPGWCSSSSCSGRTATLPASSRSRLTSE